MRPLRALYRRIYRRIHCAIKGHLPVGSLVVFQPHRDRNGVYWMSPSDPPEGALGVVIGGWRAYKRPGFMHSGSIVVISEARYDVDDWDLEVIDAEG